KDPARRYGSAEALAEDLERWLAGEAIHARPVGGLERAAKWARRRPAIAGLAAAVVVVTAAGVAGIALQWQHAVAAEHVARQAEAHAVERAEAEARAKDDAERARNQEANARRREEKAADAAPAHVGDAARRPPRLPRAADDRGHRRAAALHARRRPARRPRRGVGRGRQAAGEGARVAQAGGRARPQPRRPPGRRADQR